MKVTTLNSGRSDIEHIDDDAVNEAVLSGMRCTSDFSEITNVDVIIICVPTPLSRHREPDLSFVTTTVDSFLGYVKPGQLLSLESTTYPGTTEELLRPRLE